jgi:hypothetical protein
MNTHIKDTYKKGYSTLPNLNKISELDVFEKDTSDSDNILVEKKEALLNQNVFFECDHDPLHYEICEDWILKNYPRRLIGKKYLDIAKETEEDFLIHRIKEDKDYLSSAHVCFASHWKPEDKIGKSFDEIHSPVPMNLKNSKKLVHAMIHNGIFERFVWSIVYDNKYNFHPRFNHKKFDKEKPEIFIKIERQVTVGFSEHNFCLFILRQYLVEEKDIDKKILTSIIESMTPEQKKYKGLAEAEELICFLKKSII